MLRVEVISSLGGGIQSQAVLGSFVHLIDI